LAVIVAVRFARLAVPDLKVNDAVPSVPVVTVWLLKIPVSAPNVTVTPGTAALLALSAVTVMVVVPELSEGTDVELAESESDATLGPVTVPVVPVVATPLPPQLASRAVIAASIKAIQLLV
jgi:hypothetical protein